MYTEHLRNSIIRVTKRLSTEKKIVKFLFQLKARHFWPGENIEARAKEGKEGNRIKTVHWVFGGGSGDGGVGTEEDEWELTLWSDWTKYLSCPFSHPLNSFMSTCNVNHQNGT